MSDNTFEILSEDPVTANAKPAEKMPRIVNTNPGQSGSAEDLGGPLTKPAPGTEPTPGKAVSAKAKKLSNRITQGAGAADGMPTLQGSTPGQGGMKEEVEEEYSEEFENWVNELMEEGYDLSDYTWEEMYDIYLDEAEGSYGQTPKARTAMGKLAIARREKPASEYSQKGEKTKKVKSIEKHTRRIDNGPDAGHSGKKSTSPRWSGYLGAKGRGKMDQDSRDSAREHDVSMSAGEKQHGTGSVTKNPKKLRKQKAMGEAFENLEINVTEDVEALLRGEEFTEDFQFKAATIFEAAVKAKVVEELEKFELLYDERLQEEVEEIKESLETRVEAHLDYVSEQWLVENELAVDNGLRSELAEEFILGIKNVFESCYVDIPEDKYDVLGEMSERLDQMEEKLNEQIEVNVELNQAIGEFIKDGIIAEVSEGLAQTQKEKLASLAEGVEFISEESYREKIETIKESYFHKSQASYAEDLIEQTQTMTAEGPMAAYAAALSKWSK